MNYNNLKINEETRRAINKFKTVRDKIIKLKTTITFLIRCRNSGIIPKFIRDSTKNYSNLFEKNGPKSFQQAISRNIWNMQNRILSLSIKQKHYILDYNKKLLQQLQHNLNIIFTDEIVKDFLEHENRLGLKLENKIKNIHIRKYNHLVELQRKELDIKFNQKWFINKTDTDIPIDIQWTLSLGRKHALPITKKEFPILKMIAEGEDFVQTIREKEEQEIARTRLTTIIDDHMNKIKLSNRDKFILNNVKKTGKFLKINKNIVILNADKGNITVAMNKSDYTSRMNDILNDKSTYQILNRDPTTRLQQTNNNIVEKLSKLEIITAVEKRNLKITSAIAPKLYGVPKIHKEAFPLRPICSCINSPSHELSRYLTNILRKITETSIYNIKDSIQFKDRIKQIKIQNDEKIISLDVISLFPSIPIDLALNIIENKWTIIKEHTTIEKELFLKIVKFCIEDNRYFQYDNKIYSQQKGLPMGSPASPIIADIIMEELLDTCIGKLSIKPKIITKYVDDLFCIISECEIENILNIFNSFHQNIKFTIEKESNYKLPYLDTLIIRKGNELLIDWYQKPISSGRIINYYSKHPKRVIINTAKNLIDKVLNISDIVFHKNNKMKIKHILENNCFPNELIYKLIRQYKGPRNNNTNTITEPKIYKSLTYIPIISERLENSNIYDKNNYKIAHKTYNTLNRLFSRIKDRTEKLDKSNIIYKIPCKGKNNEICNKVYIGTTKNKLKTRLAGHKSDQKYKDISSQRTALTSHCSNLNHYPDFENTAVLNTETNYKRRFMLEMLQIINVPIEKRINFKTDTDNVAQNYRHLINKNKTRN